MGKSVLDIVIRTIKEGTGDKQLVSGLTQVKSTLQTAGMAFAALAGAAYVVDKALDATAGRFVDYASEVRAVQFATGATAEESSRLIQVADDMKVSYESLSKAMNKAVKEGVTPNIQGLADLSDQYLALAPGQERANFLLDKFGKSGGEMAELMSKGGSAIRAMSDEIDGSLILTQQAIDQAREYEIAQDALNEQWEAFALNVGQEVVPALTQLIEGMNIYLSLAKSEEETYARAAVYRNAVTMAMAQETAKQNEASAARMNGIASMYQSGDAAAEAAKDYGTLVNMMQQLNNATATEIKQAAYKQLQNDLQKSGNELTAEEAALLREAGIELKIFTEEAAKTAESVQQLNEDLIAGIITLDDYIQKLNDIPTDIHTNVTSSVTNGGSGGNGNPIPQAIGGRQEAGQPYFVHQDEVIVPAQNGYTLTRTDAMMALDNALGGRGGGGRSVTIHGGVVVQVNGGSVLDVLEELGA